MMGLILKCVFTPTQCHIWLSLSGIFSLHPHTWVCTSLLPSQPTWRMTKIENTTSRMQENWPKWRSRKSRSSPPPSETKTTTTYRATIVGTYLKTSRKEFPWQKQEAGPRSQPVKDKHHLPHVHRSCPPPEKDPCIPHRRHPLSRHSCRRHPLVTSLTQMAPSVTFTHCRWHPLSCHSDDKRVASCWIPTKCILHDTTPRLGNMTNLNTKN